ncbi:AMP-binding protein [Agromyces aerolatus]|uniref:AMP-binding protein n=1 Tax=Agromyces sp. LY-1074 TaxID=3074080 RepID=UPI002855B653|nr:MULTISPECIES: AMP-binding protein [unclassified Agromyces]MDR5699144.1 AMP-binding protein [Agromyces sp. LY-1074]MDR5705077.1 AMP-binding protein [Agromyces sp. LY-1358]
MSDVDEIPDFPAAGVQTIAAAARWAGDTFAELPAIVDGDVRWTFREYIDRAESIAAALVGIGVQPGDRVGIWAPNSADFAAAVLGIELAGAALVPLNTRFTVHEAGDVCARAQVKAVFTVLSFLDRPYATELAEHRRERPEILVGDAPIITLDGDGRDGIEAFIGVGTARHRAEVDRRIEALGPDDTGMVLFTSGTTGRPKGIRLGHGQLLRAYWQWGGILGVEPGDRVLLSNPFFHAFGLLVGLLLALVRGTAAYPLAVFSSAEALRLIAAERITFYPAPPTVFQTILQDPALEATDTSSLRMAVTGATSIPPALIRAMHDVLGIERVFSPYGLTEATGVATLTRFGDSVETIAETAGRAVPGVEVAILRPDASEADADEVGEICVRGYNTRVSYLDDDAPLTDDDGWLHTGDLGAFDAAGNLRVTGRLKDMFIVGGFNVYPAEVEAVLASHPGVSAAAVVGVPDERLGEIGAAFIIAKAGAHVDESELAELAVQRLANYKRPRSYVFVDAFPVNASGKVVKQDLAARVSAAPAAS